jgi:hypothetical protein
MWTYKTDVLPPPGVDHSGNEASGAEALNSAILHTAISGIALMSGIALARSSRVTSARPAAS